MDQAALKSLSNNTQTHKGLAEEQRFTQGGAISLDWRPRGSGVVSLTDLDTNAFAPKNTRRASGLAAKPVEKGRSGAWRAAAAGGGGAAAAVVVVVGELVRVS